MFVDSKYKSQPNISLMIFILEKCEKPKVYTDCMSACPETCDTEDGLPAMCTTQCAGKGCVCPEGMVQLSKEDTTCVKRESCPSGMCCELIIKKVGSLNM